MGVWLTLAVLASCGEDATPDPDGGGRDADTRPGPDIPWLADGVPPVAPPMLTPCPTGWREVTDEDATYCEPYPESGVASCGAGEAHFPGEPGCAPAGMPCPTGDFADGLPDDGTVIFVRAGATGGDGARTSPFGSLADVVWSSVGAGRTVALARGSYEGTIALRAGARVVGACAAETIVTGPASLPVESIVAVTSAGKPAEIRDFTIRPSGQLGIVARGAGRRITLDGIAVEGATGVALYATDGASAVARGFIARDGVADVGGVFGIAAIADTGASLEITRAALERLRDAALVATDAGTSLVLGDVLVRDMLGRELDGTFGRGVVAETGASVVVERSVFERTRETAVHASDPGTTVALRTSVVRDGLAEISSDRRGRGVNVQLGAHMEVRQTRFDRCRGVGLLASDPATRLDIADVVVRDTLADTGGIDGGGVNAEQGARVDATRLVVARVREIALFANNDGSVMTLADLVVRDVLPRESDREFGRGVAAGTNAALAVERAVVERTVDTAIGASDGASLTVTDVLAQDVRSNAANLEFGRGINIQAASTATIDRVVVRRVRDIGVIEIGSEMSLQNAIVEDTALAECATSTCVGYGFGYGLTAAGGTMSVRGFAVRRSALCGIFIEIGALDLERGEVTGSPIGACVQIDGYDLARLSRDVVYTDNGTNLDATLLPVPTTTATRE